MFETKTVTAQIDLKGDAEGSLSAVFSTFDVVDSDGDVLVREAFTDGQPVPMVWAHDWSMPIGKGVIRTDSKRAIFDGRFFTDTTNGRDAYQTVKSMGELQEYSWGFRILDAAPGERDGQPVRVITKAEVFEVSPVLVGANRETYTLAIKSGLIDLKRRRLSRHQLEAVIATLQALMGDDAAEDEPTDGEPVDTGKSAAPPEPAAIASLKGVGERLAGDLADFAARLKAADLDERLDARAWADEIARRMTATRLDLNEVLKRAEQEAVLSPRGLFATLDVLDARYGAIEGRAS